MTTKTTKGSTSENGQPEQPKVHNVQIAPANMEAVRLLLVGTTPLVQHRFGPKARQQMLETQEAGSRSQKGKKRNPKDFEACYQDARHISTEGWDGIHAAGFRHAAIDACRLVGFVMTRAKLGFFVVADGYSAEGTPLVKITKGTPRKVIHEARNASGVCDLRARPMWDVGWECILTVRYDADMFSTEDIINLVARVGLQCGICEGRPNSKDSTGCDWGLFEIRTVPE